MSILAMHKRYFFGVALPGMLILSGCKQYTRNKSHAQVSSSSIRKGEQLAKIYCVSCHVLPDPSLLDSRSWEKGVLPQMGPRLGIFAYGFELYPNSRRDTNLGKDFYPSQPVLGLDDWQHILDYYTATSPDTLPGQSRQRPIALKGLSQFDVREPALHYDMPAITLVKIDTASAGRGLFFFDINGRNLYRLDSSLKVTDSLHDEGGLVDMQWQGQGWTACNIGVLLPNNGKWGSLQQIRIGGAASGGAGTGMGGKGGGRPGGKLQLDSISLFGHLARPVQATAADFNGDGRMDWLVCEFGNLNGALSWLENKGDSGFERHIIRAVPGAIRAYVNDYNHDGKPDIWALFAQGDEGVFLFTNEGNGRFSEQALLRFPPSYGSSYFELADFNKDGYPDILYTCGDNADYSPILKPYHGVYIFLNDGHNHFTQRYFFPINGCYKAVARDFDGDGDLDIATIAFFADFSHQPEEGFVYLENLGGYDFQPYSLPATRQGKWLTMDVGDLDGDGRPDIVLGNLSLFSHVGKNKVDFKKGPPVLVLRNLGKN
jgi:hypothetical protein